MKTCGYCGRENDGAATYCCECGSAEFKASEPIAPAKQNTPKPRLKFEARELTDEDRKQAFARLCNCLTVEEADILVGRLVSGGIEASIASESATQVISWSGNARGYIGVQVPTEDFDDACQLLLADEQKFRESEDNFDRSISEKANLPLDTSMKCLMFLLPGGCISLFIGAMITRHYTRNGYTRRAKEGGACFLWGILCWNIFYIAIFLVRR